MRSIHVKSCQSLTQKIAYCDWKNWFSELKRLSSCTCKLDKSKLFRHFLAQGPFAVDVAGLGTYIGLFTYATHDWEQ